LPKQQQSAPKTEFLTENSSGQAVVGANSAKGDDVGGISLPGMPQNEFQLSDFITTIYGRTHIVAFDPKILKS
jgi:hypothetical protein